MDVQGDVLQEVALEGLDGITLPALWLRLQSRVPPFPLTLDSATKSFLWQNLLRDPELEFYQLPKERRPLVLSDRYEEADSESVVLKPKAQPQVDIYPVHILFDNKLGVKGSCQHFKERRSVTEQIKTQRMAWEEAAKRWGEKLVIVASQTLRSRTLIGWEGDPELELPDYSYCILERVGRSRWQGELQKDLQGSFKVDAGKIHYLRRILDRNGLITMQSHIIRLPNGSQQHSLLLFLKCFHTDRRNKYDMLSEKISAILCENDNRIETLVNLREALCVPEQVFKRLYHYLASAGIVKVLNLPLHEVQPSAEHCKTRRGTDIMIKCLKLLKEYKRKDKDFEEDEEEEIPKSQGVTADIIYEKDMLTQTYEFIENRGTKGVSQRDIRNAMNVGKLEARMLCRLLERYMLIKGFMEDEGRQRTTKYISHVFVEESDIRRQFLEEKAKSDKLCTLGCITEQDGEQERVRPREESLRVDEDATISDVDNAEDSNGSNKEKKAQRGAITRQSSLGSSPRKATPKGRSRVRRGTSSSIDSDKVSVLSDNDCSRESFHLESNHSGAEDENEASVIEEILDKNTDKKKTKRCTKSGNLEKTRETYRLLKRRNIIIETVKNFRLVESLFTLQKMITDQEKQEGVSTRCCKKSILRLVQRLSKEGLVRLYRTTVVQDGISKKVDLVVHPSVNPNDPLVKSAIEQIRFRISNSTAVVRTRTPQGPLSPSKADADDQNKDQSKDESQNPSSSQKDSPSKALKKTDQKMGVTQLRNYHPVIVPGLGRTLGYLPKMPRLKVTHIFLWYVVYGHPLHKTPQKPPSNDRTSASDRMQNGCESFEPKVTETSSNAEVPAGSQYFDSDQHFLDAGEEQTTDTVYVEESSWRRCVPPTTMHGDYEHGWALISDILLCLPLSIFIQIVQVSYKVDNLEDFLKDPIKKHTLIRHLPRPMRQQLLYKRRYIFSFFKGLQKLSCMGLVQFGPTEKFQDKDQVFVYMKKKITIVDTTACEPHYNLAQGTQPFEKRFYNLETFQDVENFWFDLQFVCLNTPLGVVRYTRVKKANPQSPDEAVVGQDLDLEQEDRYNLERKCGFLESVAGSREVTDDGSIPGDGLGAGGLDSSFYSHLKRNWIWISYIINNKTNKSSSDTGLTMRLQTFLNKHTLPLGPAGNRSSLFGDVNVAGAGEIVQIVKEATELRSKRVSGGRSQKRKRPKKDTGKKKKTKKKKSDTPDQEKIKKSRYHDETDQSALQRMTRQRVAWTAQEDGLLMLCRIASSILNRKVKRPFVPWQVVRDIMHCSLEESLDKTSHSVGRRARYIMKNPQTYLNYKVCLAEVYQDKLIIEAFMTQKDNYDDPQVCATEFKAFVERLREKFSTTLGQPVSEIPNTVHELFHRYRVLAIGNEADEERRIETLDSVDDIHLLVLQNLILSTLALSDVQMRSCRSFQTFRMYREYRDDILVKAFLEFQKKRLVNRRRGNHMLGPKKSRALPFVPMSFQLSQIYYRLFTWRFPSTICTESFQFLETLKTCGKADQMDLYSFNDQANEAADDMVTFPLDVPGGYCTTIISLLFLGLISVSVKIPDQIVVVDSNLVENEVMKSIGKEGLEDEDDDDEEVEEALGTKRKIEVKARQASHTNYLLMRGYCAPGIISSRNLSTNDNVVVNSCQVKVKLRETPIPGRQGYLGSYDTLISDMPGLPRRFTGFLNIKDSNFQQFLSHCVDILGYSQRDRSCVAEIQSLIEASSFYGIKVSDLGQRFLDYEAVETGRTRCLQQYIQDLVTHDQVLKVGGASPRLVAMVHAGPWLLHSNCLKGQGTQDRRHFITDTANSSLQEGENNPEPPKKKARLESSDVVNPTNLEAPEGSGTQTQDDKIPGKETFTQLRDREDSTAPSAGRNADCCFLGRPWKVVDGSLNKPVCKGMMEAVLYHIMTKPGIPEATLLQHYSNVLQPVIVLDLLQVLEDLGCIKKHYIQKSSKASLFSRNVIPEVIQTPKLCEEPNAFYEPTMDCTLRMGGIFPSEVNWNKWVL